MSTGILLEGLECSKASLRCWLHHLVTLLNESLNRYKKEKGKRKNKGTNAMHAKHVEQYKAQSKKSNHFG